MKTISFGLALFNPVAKAGDDLTVNEFDTVHFDGGLSSDNVRIEAYQWTFTFDGEVVTLSGINPFFTFTGAGKYVVTLNATDGEGNWATDEVVVTVRDKSPPVVIPGEDMEVDQIFLPSSLKYHKLVYQNNRLVGVSCINSMLDPGIMYQLVRRRVDLSEVRRNFAASPLDIGRLLMSRIRC